MNNIVKSISPTRVNHSIEFDFKKIILLASLGNFANFVDPQKD